MRIEVELRVATVRGAPAVHVATKDVDDTMLDLLSDANKVHIVTASRGTFDLLRENRDQLADDTMTTILFYPPEHRLRSTDRTAAETQLR